MPQHKTGQGVRNLNCVGPKPPRKERPQLCPPHKEGFRTVRYGHYDIEERVCVDCGAVLSELDVAV
jgi:hypothetical protein